MTCDRVWQAEAIEDGRLLSSEVRTFERHVASCRTCRAEVTALARVRAAIALLPELATSPLEHRRQRYELLRRANEQTTRTTRRPKLRPLMAAGAIALIGGALALYPRALPSARPVVAAEPHFQVEAAPNAQWRVLEAGPNLRLLARRGRLQLAVTQLVAGQRFRLALPDGEIEVQGSRFAVEIEGEQTREVRVHEGRVALRLHSVAPVLLGSGERWTPAPRTAAVSLSDTPLAPAPERQPRRPKRMDRAPPPAAVSGRGPQSEAVATSAPARDAGRDFGDAMTAFSAGDYGRADVLFRSFAQHHATDSRAEDALFLRTVALARRGELEASRRAAREYLERFPSGLRRREAERLSVRRD